MKDTDIVGLFWDRNEDAVSETKKQYEQYCMYIAKNVLQNEQDAEECFNDALLAVWKSIDTAHDGQRGKQHDRKPCQPDVVSLGNRYGIRNTGQVCGIPDKADRYRYQRNRLWFPL